MPGYKSLGFKNIFQGFSEEKRHCCFSWNRATYQIWFTLSLVENSKTFLVMCDTCHSAHKTKMSLNNTEKTTTKNNNPMSIKIDLVGMVFKWILSRATPNMSGKGAARDPRVQWTVSSGGCSPKVSVVMSSLVSMLVSCGVQTTNSGASPRRGFGHASILSPGAFPSPSAFISLLW